MFLDGKLKRVDITGGPPLSLCDAAASFVIPDWISWSRRDTILFGGSQGRRRVHTSGGAVEVVTSADRSRGEIGHGFPQFLPDRERFLYFIASNDANVQGVYAGSVSEPARRQQLIRTPARVAFAPPRRDHPAYLLWIRDRALVAQPFDPDSLQFRGDALAVTNDINVHIYNSRPAFFVSDAGVLAYFAGGTFAKRPLVWMRRGGKQPEAAAPDDAYWNLDLAPADDRIAVGRWEFDGKTGQPNLDVGIRESAGGSLWRVTTLPGRDGSPVWSPDGAEIAYASAREDGVAQIYRRKAAAGDGNEARLTDGPHYKIAVDWSADGKYIVFEERNDLMVLPLDGDRRAVPIAQTRFVEKAGTISPNGRWFAFVADYSGRPNVYVKPFKPGTAEVDQPTPVSARRPPASKKPMWIDLATSKVTTPAGRRGASEKYPATRCS